jgi:WD40 repeat protein
LRPNININKLFSLTGHNQPVYTIIPGKKENLLFSAAGDGMVALWDLNNHEQGQLVAKVPNSIYALDYHTGLDWLAIAHNYEGVHFIHVGSKNEEYSIKLTDAALFSLKFFEDDLWVGTANGELFVLDVVNRSVRHKLKFSDERLRTIDYLPAKKEVALGFSDNIIRILDKTTLELKKQLNGHSNSVFSVKYAPDSKMMLSVGRDAHIRVWDIDSDYLEIESIPAHMYAINDLAFSPGGEHFVTCSMDKSIKVWDYQSLKLLKVIDKARHAGHGTSVNKLYWSSFGKNLLASCSDDRSIAVWQVSIDDPLS